MSYNFKPFSDMQLTHRVEVQFITCGEISSPAFYNSDEQAIKEGQEKALEQFKELDIAEIRILKAVKVDGKLDYQTIHKEVLPQY